MLQPNALNNEFGTDITNFTNSQQNILLGYQQSANNNPLNGSNNGVLTTGATS
jgi:hypothetical protein